MLIRPTEHASRARQTEGQANGGREGIEQGKRGRKSLNIHIIRQGVGHSGRWCWASPIR